MIGRHGNGVCLLRRLLDVVIKSPEIINFKSNCKFVISAKNSHSLWATFYILDRMADYFQERIIERTLHRTTTEITATYQVLPLILPNILRNKGQFIIELRAKYDVIIITPRTYSQNCSFQLIGEPVSFFLL